MRKVIKIVALITLLACIISFGAGCAPSSGGKSGTEQTSGTSEEQKVTLEGSKIVAEPLTLTAWRTFSPAMNMTTWNDNLVYQELEKNTGIHIEWILAPRGQETQSFNLVIASQDLPDMMMSSTTGKYPGGVDKAIKDGVYLRLNELIDQYAPNYKAAREADEEVKKITITDDGNIWGFACIHTELEPLYTGTMIRKDWLDDLGLSIPTTISEWETVLTAFKNEKGAEVPLYANWVDNNEKVFAFSGAFGVNSLFLNVNGEVKYGPIEPGWKQYLELLNSWYKNGLIDKDFATRLDKKTIDALVTNNEIGAKIDFAQSISTYELLMQDDPDFEMRATPYPLLKKGQTLNLRQKVSNYKGSETIITTACKHIPETVKWLDYAYTKEGSMIFNYGKEGLTYTMVDGKPQFTDFMTNNPEGDFNTLNRVYKLHSMSSYLRDWRAMPPYDEYSLEAQELWAYGNTDYVMPNTSLTADEGRKYSSVMSEVTTHVDEMFLKFILGTEPLSNFDAYVEVIKKMGIDEAISLQKAALERYFKK